MSKKWGAACLVVLLEDAYYAEYLDVMGVSARITDSKRSRISFSFFIDFFLRLVKALRLWGRYNSHELTFLYGVINSTPTLFFRMMCAFS